MRGHIAKIFESWPDMRFETRRLYVREGVVTQEWTATATHSQTLRRGELEAPPSGRSVSWDGVDVIPFEDGLIKRKDVYSDSVGILRQVGLLELSAPSRAVERGGCAGKRASRGPRSAARAIGIESK